MKEVKGMCLGCIDPEPAKIDGMKRLKNGFNKIASNKN